MNRPRKQIEAAPPATDEVETPAPGAEVPTIRDEFAMRAMAAILTGIAMRGGMAAIATESSDDHVLKTAYGFADMAMGVRAQS